MMLSLIPTLSLPHPVPDIDEMKLPVETDRVVFGRSRHCRRIHKQLFKSGY